MVIVSSVILIVKFVIKQMEIVILAYQDISIKIINVFKKFYVTKVNIIYKIFAMNVQKTIAYNVKIKLGIVLVVCKVII